MFTSDLFYFSKYAMLCAIWYQLHNFKKVKKNPWRSITFSEVALKITNSSMGVFKFFIFYRWYELAKFHIYKSFHLKMVTPV